jgi:hypothetical protein
VKDVVGVQLEDLVGLYHAFADGFFDLPQLGVKEGVEGIHREETWDVVALVLVDNLLNKVFLARFKSLELYVFLFCKQINELLADL